MAKVINMKQPGTTAEGFTKYRFSGTPTDQFEHRPEVGEYRTLTVVVECVGEGYDLIADGKRHITKWRVLEATLGKRVDRSADEPELPYDNHDDDYGDGDVPSFSDGES